jgi:hypothetical protein
MLADSWEVISQSPEYQSVSGEELYNPPGGLCSWGVLQYTVHRWSGRQVSYRETSWLQSFLPTPL